MDITINDVYGGVMDALGDRFPDIPRYGEADGPEPEAERFVLRLSPVEQTRALGSRHSRIYRFAIRYVAPESGTYEQTFEVIDGLFERMEKIAVGGHPVRGTDMRYEFSEGTTHYYVTYQLYMRGSSANEPVMQHMDREVGMK
ncbi:DUF6838 family protein [Cohnella sp. GCM10027633]|uniref:phage tail terminator family protein n=1 Tax=unclassified Cohnella TaxID=2636738 RepID=UPI003637CB2D